MFETGSIRQVVSTIKLSLWRTDIEAMPRWKRVGIGVVKFVCVMARDIADGQLNLRAMSLVYTTLLSLVPLLAISFSVLKGFGVHNQIEPFLMNLLAPLGESGVEIATRIVDFVDNIEVGVLGAVGLGLLVYTVVSLMQKIESAFNFTWRISAVRPLGQRFSGYLSVLMVGPLLAFSSLGLTATMTASPILQTIVAIQPLGWLIGVAGKLVPYFLVVAAFTFTYVFMPNTRVQVKSAVVGALVSGALWMAMGWAFTTFVVASTKYTAIYSAFATLILFMMWLYMSWLVLLIGASVAFYHQHPECLMPIRSGDIHLSPRMREKLALMAMVLIGRRYYDEAPGWNGQDLASALKVPGGAMESILGALETAGFLRQTGDRIPVYLPGKPLETTPASIILGVVRSMGEHPPYLGFDRLPADGAVDRILADMDSAAIGVASCVTLKDLVLRASAAKGAEPERI